MVEIDVRKAIALNTFSGDLSFEWEAESDLVDIPFVAFSSPVSIVLHYEIANDNKVEVTGEVRFSLKGACSRCLEEAERTYTGEVDALFLPEEDDGENYCYRGGRVKLNELVRDAVVFALPQSFLCSDGCKAPVFH